MKTIVSMLAMAVHMFIFIVIGLAFWVSIRPEIRAAILKLQTLMF